MKLKTLSVSQVNTLLSNYVYTNPIFSMLSIQGEIVNLKKTNYGYIFFDLKDDESKIRCMTYKEINIEEGKEAYLKEKLVFIWQVETILL